MDTAPERDPARKILAAARTGEADSGLGRIAGQFQAGRIGIIAGQLARQPFDVRGYRPTQVLGKTVAQSVAARALLAGQGPRSGAAPRVLAVGCGLLL